MSPFLGLALSLSVLLAGCAADPSSPTRSVRIGVLYPMTGDLADKGRDSAAGVALAVEEINAAGGVRALGGAPLEIVAGDTRGVPDRGAAETERLIAAGVCSLVGAYQSSVTKPATQVAERLRTPFVVSTALADVITERGFRYTFRVQPRGEQYARDQAAFLLDLETLANYRVRRVALIHENTDFGTSTALAQRVALRRAGIAVVAEVSYRAVGVSDLRLEVASALAADPDAVVEITYLNDSILIRRALRDLGSRVPLIDTAGGTVSPEYVELLGAEANGTFTVVEFSPRTAAGAELNHRFHARFGVDLTGDSAYAYQSVWVLKDALERAASTDRDRLRDALAATDISGPELVIPSERLRFDASGQNAAARLFVAQIQGGELLPVWPPEYAVAPPRLEAP